MVESYTPSTNTANHSLVAVTAAFGEADVIATKQLLLVKRETIFLVGEAFGLIHLRPGVKDFLPFKVE